MKDEIKEINIPENVLNALGALTNGAMNYYKATETVKVRHNTILDYITNLQEKYDKALTDLVQESHTRMELESKITNLQEDYEKEHYLVDKLTRQLNDEYKNTEYQCKQKEDYKSRNEKAIEYIKQYKELDFSDLDLLNILQGEDKDENN